MSGIWTWVNLTWTNLTSRCGMINEYFDYNIGNHIASTLFKWLICVVSIRGESSQIKVGMRPWMWNEYVPIVKMKFLVPLICEGECIRIELNWVEWVKHETPNAFDGYIGANLCAVRFLCVARCWYGCRDESVLMTPDSGKDIRTSFFVTLCDKNMSCCECVMLWTYIHSN